ncbi:flagellar filament capping protein FliD [Azospirillum brasilense]|uniref:Flagellar hook-associated protein 2 n=1 Tax=Azospirillum brasilense TaxID=192 RepID=A0A235HGY4_AZOBR|nr:flagellar filament capping protein FliD [Azospirillum brasilense]OYD84817.1 flagellar hook protein FliD [Azospirillum brasilense]
MTTVSSTSSSTAASTGSSSLIASGSGTGIDYSALVEASVQKRLSRADRIDTTITTNEARIAAYEDMQDLLQAVNTSLDGLRNRNVSTGGGSNLFEGRTAYLSGGGSTSADNVLSVTAADGAETGTYSIVVEQLATRHKIGAATTSSQTAALGQSGTLLLGVAGGTAVSVDVGSGDSLTDIRDAINTQKSTSGVTASIVKVTDSQYQLILTATDTGKAITLDDGGSGVLAGLGLTDADGAYANELVAAKNAVITVDGVRVERSGNSIADAIDGLTIDLYAALPGETIGVEIGTDLSSIKSAITGFVDAYNAFRDFAKTHQTVGSSGTAGSDATLFADSLLRQVTKTVYDALNAKVTTADGGTLSLASLGITFASDNTLKVDETALNSALTGDIDAVRKLLGLEMTSSSADLNLLRYDRSLGRTDFTLDITVAEDGTLSGASVDGDESLFRVSGNRIIGNDGTAFAGLVLVYTGQTGSVDVSFSQGLADRLYTTLNGIAAEDDGDIARIVSQLEADNSDLTRRSDDITTKAEDYRTRLTAYYARLEAKAEAANLLLQQLKYKESSDD